MKSILLLLLPFTVFALPHEMTTQHQMRLESVNLVRGFMKNIERQHTNGAVPHFFFCPTFLTFVSYTLIIPPQPEKLHETLDKDIHQSDKHDGSVISNVLKKVSRNEAVAGQPYDCTFFHHSKNHHYFLPWKLGGMRKLYYPSESTIELNNSYKCKFTGSISLTNTWKIANHFHSTLTSRHGICHASGYNNAGWCEKSSSSSSSSSDSNGDDDDDDHRRK
jgi:hypothetical protein